MVGGSAGLYESRILPADLETLTPELQQRFQTPLAWNDGSSSTIHDGPSALVVSEFSITAWVTRGFFCSAKHPWIVLSSSVVHAKPPEAVADFFIPWIWTKLWTS